MHGIQAGLPEPLGATPIEGGVNFAVWAPDSDRVELCLLDENGAHWNIDLPGFTKGVYHGFVSDVGHGQRYGYRVHGQWSPEKGLRFNPAKLLVDPYAKAITGELKHHEAIFGHVGSDSTLFNSLDSSPYVPNSVVVVDNYDWEGDVQPRIPLANTVIYEAHLASVTKTHPDVPEHERGT
ncbi:MAG: glycogen debranching enzyme GlgX, partial [Actinomycetota bacterium]